MSKIKRILASVTKPSVESASLESFDENPLSMSPDEAEMKDEIDNALDPVDADIMGVSVISDPITDETNKYQAAADVVKDSLQTGGLSLEAAAILNIFATADGHDSIRARVSLESHGTQGLFESRVALEGIKDMIRDWWNRLRAFLKNARNSFAEWISNAFNSADKLKADALSLKEKAASAQPGSGDIEFAKKALLLINGQLPNVGAEMARFGQFAEGALVDVINNTYESASNMAGILGGFTLSGESSLQDLAGKLAAGIAQPADGIGNLLTQEIDPSYNPSLADVGDDVSVKVMASEPFLGNAQLAAAVATAKQGENPVQTIAALAKAMRLSRLEILDLSEDNKLWRNKGKAEGDSKIPRLSPSDAAKVADGAIHVAEALLKLKSSGNKKAELDRNVDRAGTAVSNLNINDEMEAGSSLASALRTIVSTTGSYPSQATGKLVSWFGSVTRAALSYANASLAAEKPEAETTTTATA